MLDKLKDIQVHQNLWNLYTMQEEYNPPFKDVHNRCARVFSNNHDVFVPHVSKFLTENGFSPFYPEGRKFAICLTHDIDNLFIKKRGLLNRAIKALFAGNITALKNNLETLFDKKNNLYYKLEDILFVENKYNAKSSFFFLSLSKEERDFNYSLEEIKGLIHAVLNAGCEVGLHSGHMGFMDIKKMNLEKAHLESCLQHPIAGNRNHFLNFEMPRSFELLLKSGFKYDTTVGYHDSVGFRNGMCHPYKPYNLNSGSFMDIMEIPLTIMDCTLSQYMLLNKITAYELCTKLVDTTEKYNGVLTFLWHNNYSLGLDFYEKFLQYCESKGAWITSGTEIYKWWHQHEYFGLYSK
jgi:hypothetical protein